MIIYRIYDKTNGKNYIGQTQRKLSQRIYSHLHDETSHIGNEINKKGRMNFDISVLDVCDTKEEADKAEKYWIGFYDSINNGYNIMQGGTPDKAYMIKLRDMPRQKRKPKKKQKIDRFNSEETKERRNNHRIKEDTGIDYDDMLQTLIIFSAGV
jgi:group I intron endonuclease